VVMIQLKEYSEFVLTREYMQWSGHFICTATDYDVAGSRSEKNSLCATQTECH